jgi:hypothetical protein
MSRALVVKEKKKKKKKNTVLILKEVATAQHTHCG